MDGTAFNPANPFDMNQGVWSVDENDLLQQNPHESVGSVPEILPPLNHVVASEQANIAQLELFPLQVDSDSEENLSSNDTTIDILTGTDTTSPFATFLAEEIPLAQTEPIFGDADVDGDADNDDLNVILAGRNTPASGSDDPRDLDGDGQITVLDGRALIVLLGSNTDFESPLLSASLGNDTAPDGNINNDGITFDPLIQGTLSDVSQVTRFKAGFNDTLLEDYTDILGVFAEDGSFSLTPGQLAQINGGSLAEGEQTLHLFAKDQWGNESVFDLTYTLDTVAPDTPLVNFLESEGDTLTNDNTPTLEITAEVGSTVKLLQDGEEIAQLTANLEGKVEFTLDALTDGIYEFTATATDTAGNVSETSAPLTLEIDTTAPLEPIFGLDATSDTGTLGDLETNLETVTLVGETEANATVELVGTGQTTTADETGQFQFSEVALIIGENSFTVTATDAAGNVSQNSQTITRVEDGDTTPPVPPILDLLASSDSGSSDSDNVTNENSPTIEITAESGSLVELFQNGSKVGENTANENGIAAFTIDSLADGIYSLTATATDTAGNVSETSAPLTLEIDTTAPLEPIFGLDETSDTGTLGDLETTLETVTLVGETEANATVELLGTGQTTTADETGQFQFSEVALIIGENSFTVTATDAAGNVSQNSQTITRVEDGDTTPPAPPILDLLASSDSGSSNSDNVTNDNTPTIEITAEVGSLIELFQNGSKVGENAADENGIAEFTLDSLADGIYSLTATATDVAGNVSNLSNALPVTIDTVSPTANIPGRLTTGTTRLDVTYNEAINNAGFNSSNYSLTIVGGDNDGQIINISSVTRISNRVARLTLETPLNAGVNYSLALGDAIADLAGNNLPENSSLDVAIAAAGIASVSPSNGTRMVSLTREVRVDFETKIDPTTITTDSFYLIANGQRIAGRRAVSSTNQFVTFFYDEPLPPSTEVRVVIDGNKIKTQDGIFIDGDRDGNPGGIRTVDFTTLPITRIPDTDLFGYVFDSFNTNEDGSNIPVVGATIRLDALPNVFAVTDETGFFRLEDVPAPDFAVHIDGGTAINAPEGTTYATVGKIFHSVPGEATQLTMNGEPFDIFLPPMATEDIQTLSTSEETEVGFGDAGVEQLQELFPDIDPEVWELTRVTFPPGSAQDEQGNAATQAAIIPVAPDRIPAPLPPGLDLPLVISIQAGGEQGFSQAGGATNFDVPAPIQFPNLSGSLPGQQELIWSFNHDSGEWEVIGTGTVSEDGKTIVSDEGVGILAPGWHGAAPGSPTGGPEDPPCLDTGEILDIVVDAGQAAANCAKNFFEIRESIQQIFTVASEIRSLVSSAQKILQDIDNGTLNTASGVANALAGINAGKTAVVNIIDLFKSNASPIDRALKISQCIGQAIGFAENLCNRLNTPNSPCSGPVINFVCVGLAAASSTLDKVNNLIAQANEGLARLGLAALCGTIDQIASILGAIPPSPNNFALLQSFATTNADDPIPPEIIDLLQQLVNQGDAVSSEFDPVEELGTSLQELDTDVDTLEDGIAQVRAEFETAPANAPFIVEYNNFQLRGVTNGSGKINIVLPANTEYTITIYDPATNSLGEVSGVSAAVGRTTEIPTFLMYPVDANLADTDGEGLVDKAELVLGSNINNIDTDGDGINDFAEIQQGLDPLGGQGFPTGVIANLPLLGNAREIVVEGSAQTTGEQTAYIATGSHGLAIVDASQFNNPVVQGQLNLAGDNIDVAVDSVLQIAAVAGQSGGLHLVDVADPMLPQLIQTINFNATQLDVADGLVYAASGNNLRTFDLLTGDEIQSVTLGNTVNDIALLRDKAYVLNQSELEIYDNSGSTLTELGSIAVSGSTAPLEVGRRLFVSDQYAHVGFFTGYSVIDISDPTDPEIVGSPPATQLAIHDIVTNGSGLVIPVTSFAGTSTLQLTLYDGSDPTDVSQFITSIDTPGTARAVAVASGIAYVADGSGGLTVVNYLGFDNQGQAPTVNINTSGIDLDPDLEGVQVLEGSSVPIQVDVTDDVQVRNVELLVNDIVVDNDVSFPFELNAIALPSIGNSVTVQVRAFDTGGNATLSNLLTFDVVPDTFGPLVSSTTPTEGTRRRAISGISVRFNEAIDGTLLNLNGMSLTNLGEDGVLGGGDDMVVAIEGFQLSETGRTLFITPPAEDEFIAGGYELRLDPSIISDRAGNPLEEVFTLNFTKRSVSDPLLLGEITSDRIFEGGEDQIFTFNGDAGDRIYFDGISADNFNLHARLVSPSGVTLFSFQDVQSDGVPLSLIETGLYQLIIDGANNAVGEYSFRLLDAQGSQLALDTDIEGTLDPGTSVDIFSFEGEANQKLFLDGMGDDGNADFYLYGPANQFIEATDLRFDDEFTLPGDGTYTAVIRGFGSTQSVDYSFRLITPETTATTPITIGDTVNGNISEPGEEDLFTFTGTAGQTLFYDGLAGDSSINVRVTSPSGQSLSFSNVNSDQQPVTLIETGTYQVRVDGSGATTGDYSFRALDVANAETLTLDELIEGTLDPGTSVDLFTFEGEADQKLFFDGLSDNFNGSFVVYGPANQFITSFNIASDREFTLPGDGTYTVVIQGNSTETIDYSFRLITPETTATTSINLGETVNGNISEPGEEDIFTFTGEAGQTLYYDGLIGNFNLDVQLISPSGQSLYFINSNSDRQPITLIESGTYQVRVDGSGVTTGDYSFRLLDLAEATELTLDTITEGTLDPGSQTEIFTFEGSQDQRLFLDELTNAFNVSYVVYGPGNQFIESSSFDNDITLPGDGTYFLVVQGNNFDDTPVDYRFRMVTPESNSIALTLGDTINGTLGEAGETDIYTFTGTVGQRLYFDGLDNSSIANAQLLNPNGSSIFSRSTFSDTSPITLNASGTYQLRITGSSNTGDYSFRLLDLAVAEVLALDTLITRTLDPGRKTDIFTFEGEADQLLFFDGLGDDSSSSFVVYGPTNQFITSSNVVSDREFTLPSDGTYTVLIQGSGTEPVDYSFRLETPDIMDETLTVGDTINGSIDNIGDRIRYTFTGEPGQRLIFDGLDSTFDFTARLFSPSGNEISLFSQSTSFDSSPFSLLEPGTYELIIDGNSTTTGGFSFRLLDLSTATETTLDSTVTATLDPGRETDLYQIDLQAGQTILLDGLGSESGGSYLIYGPGNQFISSSNITSDRQFTVTGDGTYTLVVQGFNETPVNYSFQFTQVSFDDPGDPTGTALSFGETVNGTISEVDEQDVYLLEATAGQRVYFDGLSNTSSFVRLVSPTGQTISSFFNTSSDQDPFVLLETGTYQVIVEGFGNTGDYSFRVFDVANATALTLGETVAGTLDPGSSVDLFTFTGEKNQQLFLDGLGDDGNADFYLYGPANQFIEATDLRFDDDIILPGDGTYVVAIRGFGSTPVDYSFRLVNPTTVSTPLTLDETVSATITEAGETDIYTFNGIVGQTLYYDGLTGDFNIDAQLISPSGQSLLFNNVNSDTQPISLTEDGVYQLRVNGSGTTGDYSFRLFDVANADTLTLDEVVEGTLDPGTSVDLFTFEGENAQKLFFDGLSDNFNGSFLIYGPANQFITSSNIRSDREFTLPGDGTYTVVIQGSSTETVDYSFRLITPETTVTTPMTIGDTVNGNISEPGEEDLFTFTGEAGQTLYYDGLTGNSSIDVQLVSPSGQSLFSFQNSNADGQPITLIESGTYQVRVDGSGATIGDYGFRLLDAANATTLTLDQLIEGTLDPGTSVDLFTFEGENAQKLFFDGLSDNFNGSFVIYGPANQFITSSNIRSDREFTLPGDGTYTVVIQGSSTETVDYSFRLITPETTVTTPMTIGDTVNGNISEPGEEDLFTFTATAGQTLYYDGLTGNSSIDVQLISPSGQSLFSFQNSNSDRQPITLIESGTYQVRVDGSGATIGDYSFRFLNAANATPLTLDQLVEGTLDPGTSVDLFTFEGEANQQLFFDGLSDNFNGSFVLYGPSNQFITSSNIRSDREFTLPGEGTYTVAIQGSGTELVDYSFRLNTPGFTVIPLTLGNTVNGSITDAGGQVTYTFTGEAGQQLYFDGMSSNSGFTAQLTSPSGQRLFSRNTNNDQQPFTLIESGVYELVIDGSGATVGDYSFRLFDTATVPVLNFGATNTGTLNPGNSSQVFKFQGSANQTISLTDLGSQNGGTYLLYGPGNQLITSRNFRSDFEITLPGEGLYTLILDGSSGNLVDYGFRVD